MTDTSLDRTNGIMAQHKGPRWPINEAAWLRIRSVENLQDMMLCFRYPHLPEGFNDALDAEFDLAISHDLSREEYLTRTKLIPGNVPEVLEVLRVAAVQKLAGV